MMEMSNVIDLLPGWSSQGMVPYQGLKVGLCCWQKLRGKTLLDNCSPSIKKENADTLTPKYICLYITGQIYGTWLPLVTR